MEIKDWRVRKYIAKLKIIEIVVSKELFMVIKPALISITNSQKIKLIAQIACKRITFM